MLLGTNEGGLLDSVGRIVWEALHFYDFLLLDNGGIAVLRCHKDKGRARASPRGCAVR